MSTPASPSNGLDAKSRDHDGEAPCKSNNKRKKNRKRKRTDAQATNINNNNHHAKSSNWSSASYPYPTDYNDHFETPQRAYNDIYPLLQYCLTRNKNNSTNNEAVIYDPYFCTGSAVTLMEKTFASNKQSLPLPSPVRIHHKKADFYVDIKQNRIPQYDILVTNPPYSGNHKERCLEFAVNQLKSNGRAFFLLMPNYVSTKDYFKKITTAKTIQIIYIAPSSNCPYEYIHPEGTGHEKSPFESVWFCGVSGNEDMKALKDAFVKFHSKHNNSNVTPTPRWAESLQGLIRVGGVSGEKRKNPRQRKKMRLLAMQKSGASAATAAGGGGGGGAHSGRERKNAAALLSIGQKDEKTSSNKHNQSNSKKAKKRR